MKCLGLPWLPGSFLVILSTGLLLAMASGGRVEARMAAALSGSMTEHSVDKSTITIGESLKIRAALKNTGDTAEHGGISVSFPDVEMYDTEMFAGWDYTNGSVYAKAFPKGRSVASADGSGKKTEHLLIEFGWDNWSNGGEKHAYFSVTPQKTGTFRISMRGWLCAGGSSGYDRCARSPNSGGVDQQGFPAYSLVITVKAAVTQSVAAPKDFVGVAGFPPQINLTWKNKADNAELIDLWRIRKGQEWERIGFLPANSQSYQDNGLTPDSEYAYAIRAFVGDVTSEWVITGWLRTPELKITAAIKPEDFVKVLDYAAGPGNSYFRLRMEHAQAMYLFRTSLETPPHVTIRAVFPLDVKNDTHIVENVIIGLAGSALGTVVGSPCGPAAPACAVIAGTAFASLASEAYEGLNSDGLRFEPHYLFMQDAGPGTVMNVLVWVQSTNGSTPSLGKACVDYAQSPSQTISQQCTNL